MVTAAVIEAADAASARGEYGAALRILMDASDAPAAVNEAEYQEAMAELERETSECRHNCPACGETWRCGGPGLTCELDLVAECVPCLMGGR